MAEDQGLAHSPSVQDDGRSERRYDLDWLRVIAFGILMLFHTGMGFDSFDWHVKNFESSPSIDEFVRVLHQWRMPLLFFISGAAVWFALEKYGTWQYLGERQKRLLIPLIFGMLVVVPPQVYCERIYQRIGYRSFFDFYRTLFSSGSYPQGNFSWHHLWYIPYIWAFSMITVPLFLWLKTSRGRGLVDGLQSVLARSGTLYFVFLPSALAEIALRPYYPGDSCNLVADWANFTHKLTFFVAGYGLASGHDLARVMASRWKHYLAVALVSLAAVEWVWNQHLQLPPAIYRCLANFHIWMWLLTALGFARRYLDINPPALRYCTNAVYPFYILHQTVIVMWLLPLVYVDLGLWTKYLLVLTGTILTTWALYAGLISRVPVLRVCFGLKGRLPPNSLSGRSGAKPGNLESPAGPVSASLFLGYLLLGATAASGATGKLLPLQIPGPSLATNRLGIAATQPTAVYLPPSYLSSDRRYPVIYLLPNFNTLVWRYTAGSYQGFRLRDAADRSIAVGSMPEVMVVIPNSTHILGSSWFRNSALTGRWEDFMTADLIDYIDSHFRTVPQARARGLAGHGAGGTAALELALKHPDLFSTVYALSPALLAEEDLQLFVQAGDAHAADWSKLCEHWRTLDPAQAALGFRVYMQARLNSPSREDLFAALRLSSAAAVCQPSAEYPGIQFPSPASVDPGTRAEFWGAILGNWEKKVADYLAKPGRLRSITLDRGGKGEFDFITRGVEHLSKVMHTSGISSQTVVGEGGHDSALGQRLQTGMLPTLAKAIAEP